MKEMLERLGKLDTSDIEKMFEIHHCAEAYQDGGFKKLYKETLKPKEKAKRDNKKNNKEQFTEINFEAGYISSQIEQVIKLLNWLPIVNSKEDRNAIADELTRLAEELRNL